MQGPARTCGQFNSKNERMIALSFKIFTGALDSPIALKFTPFRAACPMNLQSSWAPRPFRATVNREKWLLRSALNKHYDLALPFLSNTRPYFFKLNSNICIALHSLTVRLGLYSELIERIGYFMDFFSQRLEINRFGKKHFGAGINGFLIIFFVTVS